MATEQDILEKLTTLDSTWASRDDERAKSISDLEARQNELELMLDTPSRGGNTARNSFKAAESFLRTGQRDDLSAKAMSITTDADGGYTHVAELGTEIIKAVGEINPLMAEVRQIGINANVYHQLFTLSRSATGRAAENDSRSETGTPTIARVEAQLFELYAYPKISTELLNASQFDLANFLQTEVVESFDEALGTEFVTGTGTKESVGILTRATSTAGDDDSPARSFDNYQLIDADAGSPAITFDYDSLATLVHSLPVRYRRNAKFYMSTEAVETARKLKDTQGMPLWRDASGGIAGAPQTLMGYQVVEVPTLPSLGANAKPVMFGDLKKAYAFVYHNQGLGIIRDNITTPGQVKYYMRMQCVGHPMDTRALKVMRIA